MTYQELFKDFYAPNPFFQVQKNSELYQFITDFAKTSTTVFFVLKALDAKTGGTPLVHPDYLIAHCQDMGWPEWSDLLATMQKMDGAGFDAQRYMDIIDPPFPEIETEKISINLLYYLISTLIDLDPLTEMDFSADGEYHLVSNDDLRKIILANPSDRYLGKGEGRDCDDFGRRIFLAWLSIKGWGNLAMGWLDCDLIYDDGTKEYHKMCWALTKEHELWFFEPQNDNYGWKYGQENNWPGIQQVNPLKMGV